jgi:peptidoglycan/LPS O-acetylase OafA/YrhL
MTLNNPLRVNRVSYLTNLTPMRGIAALLTVIFHIDLFLGNSLVHPDVSKILHRMYLMVDFFFILSGFIMCYVYGDRFNEKVTKKDFRKFTMARFSRVYPLHFTTLKFTIFIFFLAAKLGIPKNPILQVDNNTFSIITNLLLLHSMNFHNWFTWVHASWSISTEWWAYMIFPFLVAPFFRLRSGGRALVCLLCFVGYACIMFLIIPIVTVPPEISFVKESISEFTINVAYQYGFIRCICGFILGMMMHHAFIAGWGKKILSNGWTMGLLAICAFTCMHFNLPDIITVAFFPFLLLCGAYGNKSINRIFLTKPFQRIGDWSFSIYLVHQPLLFLILNTFLYLNPVKPGDHQQDQSPPGLLVSWTICLVFIAITLLVSFLTFRFVENPARRWLNLKAAGSKIV